MEVRTKNDEEIIRKKLEDLSRKNRYQEIISVVTQSVHQSIDLQNVLDNSIEAMRKNIDKLDMVSIYLVEGDDIVVKAQRGFTKDYISSLFYFSKYGGSKTQFLNIALNEVKTTIPDCIVISCEQP